MAVPCVPKATFQAAGNDQESLKRFSNEGLQIGYNMPERDGWIMMSPNTPSHIVAKVFYVKTGTLGTEDAYTAYVVTQYEVGFSARYLQTVHTSAYGLDPGEYVYASQPIVTPTDINDTYYAVPYSSEGNILLSKLNPMIPIFPSRNEGVMQCVLEGWIYRDPDNPYDFDPDGDAISYAGGGTGSFDNSSDTVNVPSLPTLSAVSAGFVSMYTPTLTQLNNLASFLWTDSLFDPDNFKKLFTDPMECIIGLTIVPVAPPTAGSMNIKVGFVDTGVSASRLSSQYAELSCGTITAQEFWASALDYSPFTKIHIYLPYIGMREINADDIMGKTVGVTYHIDLLSGACTAFVTANGSVLYQFNGQCSINIPMAASNFTEMIHSAISAIGAVAMTASGATAASSMQGAALIGGAAQMGANAANSAIGAKPTFQHSGQMGGSGGMLAVQTPYLIIERPRQCVAESVNHFEGFPSNITCNCNDLSGFTVIEAIHLDGIACTDDEANEIMSLLKGGVIF